MLNSYEWSFLPKPAFCAIFFLIFFSYAKLGLAQDSISVVVEGEYKCLIPSSEKDSLSIVKKCMLLAQANGIESVFGKIISQNSKLNVTNSNHNSKISSEESFGATTESQLLGRWLKDITKPNIEYIHRGKDVWISVKVKGYVKELKPKVFNEDREALAQYAESLYKKAPFNEITIVENYDKRFLLSIVGLKKASFKSLSDMNRVASIQAKAQVNRYFNGSLTQEIYIIQTTAFSGNILSSTSSLKETSSGWVNKLALLTTFSANEVDEQIFVYCQILENNEK